MTDKRTAYATSSPFLSTRISVVEILENQAESDRLRLHIRAELKQSAHRRRLDPDDIFQTVCGRGLDLGRPGPRGDTLLWLKNIATNYIKDEVRRIKTSIKSERVIALIRRDFNAITHLEISDEIQCAIPRLSRRDGDVIRYCLEGGSGQAMVSSLGFRSDKAARDARCRAKRSFRRILESLRTK